MCGRNFHCMWLPCKAPVWVLYRRALDLIAKDWAQNYLSEMSAGVHIPVHFLIFWRLKLNCPPSSLLTSFMYVPLRLAFRIPKNLFGEWACFAVVHSEIKGTTLWAWCRGIGSRTKCSVGYKPCCASPTAWNPSGKPDVEARVYNASFPLAKWKVEKGRSPQEALRVTSLY